MTGHPTHLMVRLARTLRFGFPGTLVQGFWHGAPLAPLHHACLSSFVANGHRFDLYSYDPLDVPRGVTVRSAAEIVPRDELFLFDNRHTGQPDVAPFTDYFRLRLLSLRGGWWCDVDTVCLSPDLPRTDRAWSRQAPEYRPGSVGNGQIRLEPGDALLRDLIAAAEQEAGHLARRESIGPELLSRLIAANGLPLDMAGTPDTFYPVRFIENFKLWLPEFREEVAEKANGALFLPVFQSFPARLGFNNDRLPPKGSYLRKAVARYAPDARGPQYEAADFRAAIRAWFKLNPAFIEQLRTVSAPDIGDWLAGAEKVSKRRRRKARRGNR
jgi:hypothetical protein